VISKLVSRQLPDDAVEILRVAARRAAMTGKPEDHPVRECIVRDAIYQVRLMYPHLFNKVL